MAGIGTVAAVTAAAASGLLYLNARHSLSHDLALMSCPARARARLARLSRKDRLNIFYCLEEHAQDPRMKELEFLVYNGRSWSFGETYETVLKVAGWLRSELGVGTGSEEGIGKGRADGEGGGKAGTKAEVVALDFTNCPEFVFLLLAVWSLGATPAFINYNLTGQPLVHSVKVSTARILIVDPEVARSGTITREIEDEFAKSFFLAQEEGEGVGKGGLKVVHFDAAVQSLMAHQSPYRAPDSVRAGAVPRDPAILIYTSGTTGQPKPAIVSWQKLHIGGGHVARWLGLRPATHANPDRFYTSMPLYHASATIMGLLCCLMNGTTFVLGHRFTVNGYWKDVRDSRATVVQYVGEMCRYLLAAAAEPDPENPSQNLDKKHNVRIAFGNGLRPDVWERFRDRFGIETIAEFYAATEGTSGSWNFSRNIFSSGAVGRTGAVASWIVGREVSLVDVDYENEAPVRDPESDLCIPVPRGEKGELLYKLNANDIKDRFQGYFNDPSASEKKVIRNVLKKGDAWFRTGDVLIWDKEGRWWFIDRLGDTFRWKSENVSTAEVAQVLGLHTAVTEANVYGVQIPGHEGRAGCAAVTLAQDPSSQSSPLSSLDDIMEDLALFLGNSLPKYSVPLFIRVTKDMQRTGTLKQQKNVLRNEGIDLATVEEERGEELWWLRGGKYVRFRKDDWDLLTQGKVRL